VSTSESGDESHGESEPRKSFWTTLPGILTAGATILTAIGGLIGTLAATGLIGGDEQSASPSASSTVDPSQELDEAVFKGNYNATVQIVQLTGSEYLGANRVWAFDNPQEGKRRQDTWTLTSVCPDRPCDVTWDAPTAALSSKFQTLERDGGTYEESVTDAVAHCEVAATVDRSITLSVVDAADIAGIWTVTRFDGTITIHWICDTHPFDAVLTVEGSKTGETS
jgi:hypothetical protein